jgi:hypothetical protein
MNSVDLSVNTIRDLLFEQTKRLTFESMKRESWRCREWQG